MVLCWTEDEFGSLPAVQTIKTLIGTPFMRKCVRLSQRCDLPYHMLIQKWSEGTESNNKLRAGYLCLFAVHTYIYAKVY